MTLPASIKPKYDNSLAEYGCIFFRTRKDICYHVWYVMDKHDFNIFKEGPYYAVRLGNKIYATGWRNLKNFTVEQLEHCINKEYFTI